MRSPELSRLYLHCAPDEDVSAWPDERVWAELPSTSRSGTCTSSQTRSSHGTAAVTGRCSTHLGDLLRRVWRAAHFSWSMTTMVHRRPDGDEFDLRLQLSQLRYLRTSRVAATSLAENYVGIESV